MPLQALRGARSHQEELWAIPARYDELVPAVLLPVLAIGAASCGSPDESSGETPQASSSAPIIIGAAVAQSGPFQLYDDGQTAGMQYAIDKINASGGVIGRQLKLVIVDHKSDQAQIQAAADQVLADGADFVVSTVDYDFGAPAAIAATKAGKISISGAGALEFGKQGLGELHFNVYQSTPTESAVMASFAKGKGLARPYLLEDTSIQYSKSLCDEFNKVWTSGGGDIAGRDTFKNSDPSIANQVTKLRAAEGVDFVVMCSYPPGGASAIKQIRTAGIDVPIVGGAGFDGTFWTDAIPDLSNFFNVAMVSSSGDDPNPDVNALLQSVKWTAPSYAVMGYSNIEVLAKAIEAAGTTDSAKVASAIEGFKGEKLLAGPTTYSADCHTPVDRPMALIEKVNGKDKFIEYVTPTGVSKAAC